MKALAHYNGIWLLFARIAPQIEANTKRHFHPRRVHPRGAPLKNSGEFLRNWMCPQNTATLFKSVAISKLSALLEFFHLTSVFTAGFPQICLTHGYQTIPFCTIKSAGPRIIPIYPCHIHDHQIRYPYSPNIMLDNFLQFAY